MLFLESGEGAVIREIRNQELKKISSARAKTEGRAVLRLHKRSSAPAAPLSGGAELSSLGIRRKTVYEIEFDREDLDLVYEVLSSLFFIKQKK